MFESKVLCDSISPDKVRLTTLEVTLPRIVLAEFNTHRRLSRNSASSRAIPVEKMIKKVKEDPFIPVYWGKNQKGMQADQELTPKEQEKATKRWLYARDQAVQHAEGLLEMGIHKQITNRLLEPWLWHTIIVTATEWDNFWGLRCNKDAQPEIKTAADMMRSMYMERVLKTYTGSAPTPVNYGEWHMPLLSPSEAFDLLIQGMTQKDLCKISVGRCARVSYLTHDGKRDPKADIELYERLAKSGHMSPLEHVARPMTQEELYATGFYDTNPLSAKGYYGNICGWMQHRKEIPGEDIFGLTASSA